MRLATVQSSVKKVVVESYTICAELSTRANKVAASRRTVEEACKALNKMEDRLVAAKQAN